MENLGQKCCTALLSISWGKKRMKSDTKQYFVLILAENQKTWDHFFFFWEEFASIYSAHLLSPKGWLTRANNRAFRLFVWE